MSNDPNANLFGGDEEEMETIESQLWEKNPRRCTALKELWYEDLVLTLDEEEELPEEGKRELLFMMAANGVMDLIMEAIPDELAIEMSYGLDTFVAVSLVNKRYNTNLFEEMHKALLTIKRENFDNDECYEKALAEAEEHWWTVPQPLLDQRNPNDAIIEILKEYKLSE